MRHSMETIIPDESFGALYRRAYSPPLRSGVPYIDQMGGLRSGQLVEIIGPHQSGKTKLLIQIAVRCILPMSCDGLEKVALMIDLDHKMDVEILISHLQKHIQDDSILEECLQRFQLITCDSTFEFLATLRVLPTILSTDRDSLSPLGCILIDNWNAFYAMEKAKSSLEHVPMTLESSRESAFYLIQELQSLHVPIIITKNNPIQTRVEERGEEVWHQSGLHQNKSQGSFTQRFYLTPLDHVQDAIRNRWGLPNRVMMGQCIVIKSILPDGPPRRLEFEL